MEVRRWTRSRHSALPLTRPHRNDGSERCERRIDLALKVSSRTAKKRDDCSIRRARGRRSSCDERDEPSTRVTRIRTSAIRMPRRYAGFSLAALSTVVKAAYRKNDRVPRTTSVRPSRLRTRSRLPSTDPSSPTAAVARPVKVQLALLCQTLAPARPHRRLEPAAPCSQSVPHRLDTLERARHRHLALHRREKIEARANNRVRLAILQRGSRSRATGS